MHLNNIVFVNMYSSLCVICCCGSIELQKAIEEYGFPVASKWSHQRATTHHHNAVGPRVEPDETLPTISASCDMSLQVLEHEIRTVCFIYKCGNQKLEIEERDFRGLFRR